MLGMQTQPLVMVALSIPQRKPSINVKSKIVASGRADGSAVGGPYKN